MNKKEIKLPKIVLVLIVFFAIFSCQENNSINNKTSNLNIQPIKAEKMLVVTSNKYASNIGLKILEQGGNAFDAAIAVAFALSVVEPANCGIGGEILILGKKISQKAFIIDGISRSPSLSEKALYISNNKYDSLLTRKGGLAVCVPGTLATLELLHEKYCTKTFKELIKPSIELAKNGFIVNIDLAKQIEDYKTEISDFPELKKLFYKDDQNYYKKDDKLILKDIAKTYEIISKKKSKYFYKGEFAKKIANTINKYNGK